MHPYTFMFKNLKPLFLETGNDIIAWTNCLLTGNGHYNIVSLSWFFAYVWPPPRIHVGTRLMQSPPSNCKFSHWRVTTHSIFVIVISLAVRVIDDWNSLPSDIFMAIILLDVSVDPLYRSLWNCINTVNKDCTPFFRFSISCEAFVHL